MDGHEADSEGARSGAQIAATMLDAGHDDDALDLGDSVGHIDYWRNRSIYGDDGGG
jgi:hypothetical protein